MKRCVSARTFQPVRWFILLRLVCLCPRKVLIIHVVGEFVRRGGCLGSIHSKDRELSFGGSLVCVWPRKVFMHVVGQLVRVGPWGRACQLRVGPLGSVHGVGQMGCVQEVGPLGSVHGGRYTGVCSRIRSMRLVHGKMDRSKFFFFVLGSCLWERGRIHTARWFPGARQRAKMLLASCVTPEPAARAEAAAMSLVWLLCLLGLLRAERGPICDERRCSWAERRGNTRRWRVWIRRAETFADRSAPVRAKNLSIDDLPTLFRAPLPWYFSSTASASWSRGRCGGGGGAARRAARMHPGRGAGDRAAGRGRWAWARP